MTTESDCFEELIKGLARLNKPELAREVKDALLSGATGSEILGLAGIALRRIRMDHKEVVSGELAPVFAACVRAVQSAWPKYK
jgi:hypothetical protein